jgi:putative FmdB family regulatory protein
MPIFEYKCDDCGEKFEKLVRGGDQVQCPQCGESHLTTQFSRLARTDSSQTLRWAGARAECAGRRIFAEEIDC